MSKNDTNTKILSAAALISASLLLGSAHAQQSPDSAAQPAKAPVKRAVLEEVVVTARRREENLQTAPVAVSALSGDAMRQRGIANTSELTKSVPSLEISQGRASQIYIRGVGQRSGFARVDPTVGV